MPTPTASRQNALVVNFATTTTSVPIIASGVSAVAGWSLTETTGVAVAKLTIYDNPAAASGTSYATVTLAANESWRDWFADLALTCTSGGLYLAVLAGSVSGSIYYV